MYTRHIEYEQKDIDYFWDNVIVGEQEECWEWCGPINHDGYGQYAIKGKTVRAHRFSYTIHYGQIPHGMVVRHFVCDNPCCCNPFHLRIGTQSDNIQDTCARNNQVRLPGEANGAAKLTNEQVFEIRNSYASNKVSYSKLAKKFGVSTTNIKLIVTGKKWIAVGGPIFPSDNRIFVLNDVIVREARALYESGEKTAKELCAMFSICEPTMRQMLSRRTWKHVP